MATGLEERLSDVQKLTKTQLDVMNELILKNEELNHKDVEIENLKLHKDILKNELKIEKESMERFNKPKEAMKYFEELMKSSSYSNGLGHSCNEEGESSMNRELRNAKSKGKPTCYHCGKTWSYYKKLSKQTWYAKS